MISFFYYGLLNWRQPWRDTCRVCVCVCVCLCVRARVYGFRRWLYWTTHLRVSNHLTPMLRCHGVLENKSIKVKVWKCTSKRNDSKNKPGCVIRFSNVIMVWLFFFLTFISHSILSIMSCTKVFGGVFICSAAVAFWVIQNGVTIGVVEDQWTFFLHAKLTDNRTIATWLASVFL